MEHSCMQQGVETALRQEGQPHSSHPQGLALACLADGHSCECSGSLGPAPLSLGLKALNRSADGKVVSQVVTR